MRKRILSFGLDFIISIVISIILSVAPLIFGAILALVLLPFVATDGDTWNPILLGVMNGTLLLCAFVFLATSLGPNFRLTLTWGYKINGLLLVNKSKLRLFTWWFIRNGIAGLFIFFIAYHAANETDSRYLLFPLFIYIIYLGIDGIVFLQTKGRSTFTDRWTGVEVIEKT